MRKYRFLVVDDNPNSLSEIQTALKTFGGEVIATDSWVEAMKQTDAADRIDLMVMGPAVNHENSIELIREARANHPLMPIIAAVSGEHPDRLHEFVRLGAEATVGTPIEASSFSSTVGQALRVASLDHHFNGLRFYQNCPYRPLDVLNSADNLEQALGWTQSEKTPPAPVLILGDAGTEKPFLAKALHVGGRRREHRFTTHLFDCQAVNGGTLFIDEVADLKDEEQKNLYRLIHDGVFLTDSGPAKVDVQVIAATRKDLETLVKQKAFLAELFDALSRNILFVPSLRDRQAKIPVIAERLILRFAEEEGREPPRMTEGFQERLKSYDWPGNLGELRSVIERAMLLADENALDTPHLPSEISGESNALEPRGDIIPFVEREQAILRHALQVTGGKIPEAAKRLAIGRATLYRKVKKYNLR